MRIPHPVFAVGRYALALGVVAGSVVLYSATKTQIAQRVPVSRVTTAVDHADPMLARKDLAARSITASKDAALVNFVRPGMTIAVQSAKVTSDGTISVDYKLLDPKGQPLDLYGLVTPGNISLSFIAAYIPKGAKEFWAYTTRVSLAVNGKGSAVQASGESISSGTTTVVALGEYLYTFKAKAVRTDPSVPSGSAFDATVTHRIGIYGSRNLSEFDLGTNYASTTYDFVPNGSAVTYTRDVIRTASCNRCHDQLAAHGGSRRGMDMCIMCHTSQTVNPATGNTVDAPVFFHKLHMGESLPSVKSGTPYQILTSHGNADYSTVVFPANPGDPRNCQICHDPKSGAAQANIWLTSPSRSACGSCHDDVNFATGANHANLPQANDNACSQCHQPTGQYSFDTSITGAHVNETAAPEAPGINLSIVSVANAAPGKAPLVTFTIKDNAGNAITMAQMTGGANGLSMVMAGPTNDYGYTNFGVSTPGYVSETVTGTAQCNSAGTCTYQFVHAIPANAKGTFAIGMQGRRALSINPGTTRQVDTEYGAKNVVTYFSVDGTPVVPRRTVVSINNCNNCHGTLSLHGENRNQIEMCVLCHNPSEGDESRRPNAQVPADKTAPVQGINFAYMIHRIHTGEQLQEMGAGYTIVGYGGSHNDFSEVRYPAMSPTGSTAYTKSCYMCHINGSESVLPITSAGAASTVPNGILWPTTSPNNGAAPVGGFNAVTNPSALVSPLGATSSACSGCHAETDAMAHSLQQTNSQFGESCAVCHGTGAEFNATDIHKAN